MVSSTCTTSHGARSLLDHRALIQLAVLPVEAPLAPGRAQQRQDRCRPRGAAAAEVRSVAFFDGAVAIDAIDLDRVARFAVQLAVAVTVLLEVAVRAVHALFEMDVLEMDGLLEICPYRPAERR